MTLAKKADSNTLWIVIGAVLALLAAWLLGTIMTGSVNNAWGSVTACEQAGGECRDSCSLARTHGSGRASCDEGEVCCLLTPEEIEQRDANKGILPPGSRQIIATVSGHFDEYTNGDSLRLMRGREYQLTFTADTTTPGTCEFVMIDKVSGDTVKHLPGTTCTGKPIDILLTLQHARQDLEMRFIKTEQDGTTKAAVYQVVQLEPLTDFGLDGKWTKQENFTIRCLIGNCEQAQYIRLDASKGRANAYTACTKGASTGMIEKFGGSKDVQFSDSSAGATESYACIKVQLKVASGNPTYVYHIPEEIVRVDTQPPTANLQGTTITCDDGAGSGCATYHYVLLDQVYESSIDYDQPASVFSNWLQQLFNDRANSIQPCPTPPYPARQKGDINIGSNLVFANVCYYVEDNAGNRNTNKPSPKPMGVSDNVKNSLLSQLGGLIAGWF